MCTFSERNDLRTANIPITIRYDAPQDFRLWLCDFVLGDQISMSMSTLRTIVCRCAYIARDHNNWAENGFMRSEIETAITDAHWYYVYDIVESIFTTLPEDKKDRFALGVNQYWINNGIGWQFSGTLVIRRGDEVENQIIDAANQALEYTPTAQRELTLAIQDLSKRPNPDHTGCIHHSLAALECFCGVKFHAPSSTLGEIIQRNRTSFPSPLDKVCEKMWGYASNYGRHVHEGDIPSEAECAFVLSICASLISYLDKTINIA